MFLYSPLINAGQNIASLTSRDFFSCYVKEITQRPIGIDQVITSFAQVYAISNVGDNETFYGEYRVYLNGDESDPFYAAEMQVRIMGEFQGAIEYGHTDDLDLMT